MTENKIHYVDSEKYKKANYERTLCGRDMWEVSFSKWKKDITCKECIKKFNEQ